MSCWRCIISDEFKTRQAENDAVDSEGWRSILIEADAAAVWALLAGFDSWDGLLPHVTALRHVDRRERRSILRVRVRPVWWCQLWVWSGVDVDPERRRLIRWYPVGPAAGIVEHWHVEAVDDGLSKLQWKIQRRGPRHHLASRLFIEPLAIKSAEMWALLAEADRLARTPYP